MRNCALHSFDRARWNHCFAVPSNLKGDSDRDHATSLSKNCHAAFMLYGSHIRIFAAGEGPAWSALRPRVPHSWWRKSVVREDSAHIDVGYGEIVNSAVTKLLMLPLVSGDVRGGKSCANVLSAGCAGRSPMRAADDTWSRCSPTCPHLSAAPVSRRSPSLPARASRRRERGRRRRQFLEARTVRRAGRRGAGGPGSSLG